MNSDFSIRPFNNTSWEQNLEGLSLDTGLVDRIVAATLMDLAYVGSKDVIIDALKRISKDDRKSVVEAVAVLMHVSWCTFDIDVLMEAVGRIPIDERVSVAEDVAPLMNFMMNGKATATLVELIASVSKPQRESVVRAVALLIKQPIDSFESWNICDAIRRIPEAERVSVVVAAALFISDMNNYDERIEVLNVMRDIPSPVREVKAEALQRLVADLSPHSKLSCIQLASTFHLITINQIAALPTELRLMAVQLEHGRAPLTQSATSYQVTVERGKIHEDPRAVLHDLVEKFKAGERSKLSVVFLGEPGIDASGLSREFISLLFDSLKNNLRFGACSNKLFRFTELQNDEERVVYRELGQLILFCLYVEVYPIGMVFDRGVFSALLQLLQNPDASGFDAYKALHCNEDDKNKIDLVQMGLKPLDADVSEDVLKSLFSLVQFDCEVEKLHIQGDDVEAIKTHYLQLQDALNRAIQESMQPFLELVQGIKSAPFTKITWQHVRGMSPEEFSILLQGRFSKELVLNSLKFDAGFPEEKRKWIQDWIQAAPNEQLKQFLFALTGSSAVGKDALLQIHNRGENINFHTCFCSVDIPLDGIESKELLVSLLESAISDPGKYSRS